MGRLRAQAGSVSVSFPEEVDPRLPSVPVAARLGEEVRGNRAVQMAVLGLVGAVDAVAGELVAGRVHARRAS